MENLHIVALNLLSLQGLAHCVEDEDGAWTAHQPTDDVVGEGAGADLRIAAVLPAQEMRLNLSACATSAWRPQPVRNRLTNWLGIFCCLVRVEVRIAGVLRELTERSRMLAILSECLLGHDHGEKTPACWPTVATCPPGRRNSPYAVDASVQAPASRRLAALSERLLERGLQNQKLQGRLNEDSVKC